MCVTLARTYLVAEKEEYRPHSRSRLLTVWGFVSHEFLLVTLGMNWWMLLQMPWRLGQ